MEGLLPDTVLATARGKQGQLGDGKATAKKDSNSSTKNEVASRSQVSVKGLSTSQSKQPGVSNTLANAQNNKKNKDGMKQSKGSAKETPGIKLRESHIILANPKAKSHKHKNEPNKSQRNATNSKPTKENSKHGKEHSKTGKENLRQSKGDAKQKPKQTSSKSGPTKQIKKVTFDPLPSAPLDDILSWDQVESKEELRYKPDIANFLVPKWLKEKSCLDPTKVSPKTSGVEVSGDVSHFHGEDIKEKSGAVILSSPANTSDGEKIECGTLESVIVTSENTESMRVEAITNENKLGSPESSTLASELSVTSLVEPNAIVDVKGTFIHGSSCAEPSLSNMESPAETFYDPSLGKTDHSPEDSTENEIVHTPVTQKNSQATEKDSPKPEDLLVNECLFFGHPPPGFCLGPKDASAKQDSYGTNAECRGVSPSFENASSDLQSRATSDNNNVLYMDNTTNNLPINNELLIDPLDCDKEDSSDQHPSNESPEQFVLFPSGTEATAAEVDGKSPMTVCGMNDEYNASAILDHGSALHTQCSESTNLHCRDEADVGNFSRPSAPDTCNAVDTQREELAEMQDLPIDRADVDANNPNSGLCDGIVGSNDQQSDELDDKQLQFEYPIEKSGVDDKHFGPHNLCSDEESKGLRYETIDESNRHCIGMTGVAIDEGIPMPNIEAHHRTNTNEADPDELLAARAPLDYAAPGQPDEIPSENAPLDEFGPTPCEHPDGVMYEDVAPKDDGLTYMAYMLAPTAEGLETAMVDYADGTVKDVDGCVYMPHGQINMPEMPLDAQPCDIRLRTLPAAQRDRMYHLEDQITAAHAEIVHDCGSGGTYSQLYQKLLEIKRLDDQYEKFMNDNLRF